MEEKLVTKLSGLASCLYNKIEALDAVLLEMKNHEETIFELSGYCKSEVITAMSELRAVADELESITAKKYWPFPTYGDLLFYA